MPEEVPTEKEIEAYIRQVISQIGELDMSNVSAEQPFRDLGLDSMTAVEIMAAVESRYKIELQEKDVLRFKNIKDTVQIIADYLRR